MKPLREIQISDRVAARAMVKAHPYTLFGEIMKSRQFQIGDRVTVKERVGGYGSGYVGNDVFFFSPGMVGIVGAVNVPAVWGNGSSTFICVDFTLLVERRDRTNGELLGTTTDQRCASLVGNLVLLPE